MERLPQEIIDRICEYIFEADEDDLKNTLFVSRFWQRASERASGEFAEFTLTDSNSERFLSLYSGHRRGFLRRVLFETSLPRYDDVSDDEGSDDEDHYEGSDDEGGKGEDDDDINEQQGSEEPAPQEETHRCRESREELFENDKIFTNQINYLFSTLRELEDRDPNGGIIHLTIYTPTREVKTICPHRRCTSWRIHLLEPDVLLELNSVGWLSVRDKEVVNPFDGMIGRPKLDLRILIDLAVKLPQLQGLETRLTAGEGCQPDYDSEELNYYLADFTGPHRDSRHNFAQALEKVKLPSSLRLADLDFMWPLSNAEHISQIGTVSDLVSPAKEDPFSSSLRLISQQLHRLELKVVADASLFWPASGEASFPHLESLIVVLHMSTPSGKWYFNGPDGRDIHSPLEECYGTYPPYADIVEDQIIHDEMEEYYADPSDKTCLKFRVEPNDQELVPFLTAFAKAAANMPKLKEALLWTPLLWDAADIDDLEGYDEELISEWPDMELAWGIAYVAPGTLPFHIFPGRIMQDARQLWWTTGGWRPSDSLRELFQKIGQDKAEELVEYWAHDMYGEKLALRDEFECFDIFDSRNPRDGWPSW